MRGAHARVCLLLLATLAVVAPGSARAQERYRRDWSDYPGMPRNVADLTYDDRGFLWLAGDEGVHRFDGHEVVPWGEQPEDMLVGINRSPDARMVVWSEKGLLFDVTGEGLARIEDPPFEDVRAADFDDGNNLWVADVSGVYRRDTAGDWTQVRVPELDGQTPSRLCGAPGGGAYVGTGEGRFLRIFPGPRAEVWFEEPTGLITRIAVKDERTQAFGLRFGQRHGVFVVTDGVVRQVVSSEGGNRKRWTGLTFRDDTLWAMTTAQVYVISADGESVETLGPEEGFEPGGELVVDHEKSLWATSFRGLYQFTEPDVILWKNTDGTRGIHTDNGQVVLARWDGAQRLTPQGTWQPLVAKDHHTFGPGDVSPWGSYWFVAVKHPNTPRHRSALLEFHDGGWTSWLEREYGVFLGEYASDDDGVFWILFFNSLWRVDGPGVPPREIAPLGRDKPYVSGLEVRGRQLSWASRFEALFCEGTLERDKSALEDGWDCEEIDGAGEILDFVWFDGEPWVASWNRGLLRRRNGSWETVLDGTELGSDTIRGVEPSPRGGLWVTTYLERARFVMQDGEPRIVERLGPWIGVPAWRNFEVFEQTDGSIWVSGFSSAIWVPAHARQRPTDPPRVFVTGFRTDGRELSPDEPQQLDASTKWIELSWAAPAFRDPASIRFQVRADSRGDWVPTTDRSFRFAGLGPGDYRVEVRASLDGERWSETPADIRFAIRSPFWQRPTFWVAMLGLATIAVLLVQWARAREQVRLERQRTDIAMNLHDELGAGLGSIGLLTDLAADESMDAAESRRVAVRVGEISRGLSRGLSDIVWTLRPQSVDLPGFALFLRQRASDLLSAAETKVGFEFPDPLPATRIELAVRRQIHAIASEALHNAAKHAEASNVQVALRPEGQAWVLTVTDDGVGLDDGERTGLGLESMKRRAETIGARLSIGVGPRGGCRVELRFTSRVEGPA